MQTLKVLKNAKRGILSFLLHYANRETKHENFYKIKNKILQKYGEHIGYDIQFIEGKKCFSCNGTGIYQHYYDRQWIPEDCFRCYDGWYKRPTWNILQRVKLGKYTFHQPFKRVYEKPDIETPIIEGYIDHNRTKYGGLAVFILCFIYEPGYLKRFYNESGIGWRCYWWEPRNWVLNAIHIYKNGRNSYPARLYVDPSMVACASGGEAQSQSEGFYCADWNRCGAICEEQCPACKKADRAELL